MVHHSGWVQDGRGISRIHPPGPLIGHGIFYGERRSYILGCCSYSFNAKDSDCLRAFCDPIALKRSVKGKESKRCGLFQLLYDNMISIMQSELQGIMQNYFYNLQSIRVQPGAAPLVRSVYRLRDLLPRLQVDVPLVEQSALDARNTVYHFEHLLSFLDSVKLSTDPAHPLL